MRHQKSDQSRQPRSDRLRLVWLASAGLESLEALFGRKAGFSLRP